MSSLVIGGVTCTIVESGSGDGVVERVPEDGPEAVVTFQCAYAQRYTLIKALLGTSAVVGVAPAQATVRTLAYAYPPSPNLVCVAIGDIRGLKPSTDASGWVQYKYARFAAIFRRPRWQFDTPPAPSGQNDPSGQPWTTTRFRASAETYTPPGGQYYYETGGNAGQKVEESSIGVVRPRVEVQLVRHWMPYAPLSFAVNGLGKVNLNPITIADYTFAKGYLLFSAIDSEKAADTLGNITFEWTYTFLGNVDAEWNQFQDGKGAWVYINTAANGSGNRPFSYYDFWSGLP